MVRLIGLLDDYSLMPALKGIMAMLSGESDWLRVRAPLVALTPDEFQRLEKTIRDFGMDPESDGASSRRGTRF